MTELRYLHTTRSYFDSFSGESRRQAVMVLQYRKTINDYETTYERLWSEWTDVPDVYGEENQ